MDKKTIHLDLGERGYDIIFARGGIRLCGEVFDLQRKVFIVTDSGVPEEYAKAVASFAKEYRIVTVNEGEGSKSIETYSRLLSEMADFSLTRSDCAVAVGGGVVGDLTGFAAASYMRGIDFYNIPTTLLSSVDSSIGGKTAINHAGIKNIVGAFHQPRAVIVDPELLRTLPKRQLANGLAEALKMSLTSDKELFSLFERFEYSDNMLDEIIYRSLLIKKAVVEKDEREGGLRRILNFGHTLGHGIEAKEGMHGLYHGECVALGMLAVCSDKVRERLLPVLSRLELPTEYEGELEGALSFISHDKKCDGGLISAVLVDEPGSFRIEKMPVAEFARLARERLS